MQLSKWPLGSSGVMITRVGFGSWAIGGGGWSFGWGPQDDEASVATMRHALESGINWIDTAAVYGLGHSEEVVGRLLKKLPISDRPLVFTKCGLIWDERDPMAPASRVLKPQSIRLECEASLRRLGVERIDLYQFHWPDETGTPVEDSWGEMVRLIDEGKVRMGGVSNFDVALLERCEAIRHVDSLQPPFSLIHRAAGAAEIAWCAEHNTGVIVYSPMQSGLLTDRFDRQRVTILAEDDWRRHDRGVPGAKPAAVTWRCAMHCEPIAERHNTTISAVAVAWTIGLAGRFGRDCRSQVAAAGGWLDRRRGTGVDGFGPRRNLVRNHQHRRGNRSSQRAMIEFVTQPELNSKDIYVCFTGADLLKLKKT